ncbi:hypothetical protein [Erysipelothrix aquatica]|uniref:hypothetical protein n=1 Tax=Erysipelothrix aquatica TaxID=2683714 RepID=UPI00135A1341|nr:hypothetical protein [Erysipelothrix aquatica]
MSKLSTQEAVQNAINELDFQSLINKQVKEHATNAVKEVIEEQFKWNGPMKKHIDEEFKKAATVDLSSLGIEGLSLVMSEAIVEATNELIAGETKEAVQKHLYKALDGVSKINNINSLVKELVDQLDKKDEYGDEDVSGTVLIEYHEERSSWTDYVHKYWTIVLEGEEGGTNLEESIKFCVLEGRKGKVYSVDGKNIDKLDSIYEKLKMCDKFNLLGIVKEEEFDFDNSCFFDC